MTAPRYYFTLITLENVNGLQLWQPQFGDYDKNTVKQEIKDSYADRPAESVTMMISEDNQMSICDVLNLININALIEHQTPHKITAEGSHMGRLFMTWTGTGRNYSVETEAGEKLNNVTFLTNRFYEPVDYERPLFWHGRAVNIAAA